MIGRRALVVLALVSVAPAAVWARTEVRITPIPSKGRVLVSFTAGDAWTLGAREVLQAAQQLSFEYEVELRRSRPFWFFDRVLARARVSSSAKFDTLTGGYKVTRMRSGTVVQSERRDQEVDVREWLTTFDQVVLDPVSPLEPNQEYSVRVVLTIRPRRSVSLWSLLPFGRDEHSGRESFTYIR